MCTFQLFTPVRHFKDIMRTNCTCKLCRAGSEAHATTEGQKKRLLPLKPESWDLDRCSRCTRQLASQTSTWNVSKSNQSWFVLTGRSIYIVTHLLPFGMCWHSFPNVCSRGLNVFSSQWFTQNMSYSQIILARGGKYSQDFNPLKQVTFKGFGLNINENICEPRENRRKDLM